MGVWHARLAVCLFNFAVMAELGGALLTIVLFLERPGTGAAIVTAAAAWVSSWVADPSSDLVMMLRLRAVLVGFVVCPTCAGGPACDEGCRGAFTPESQRRLDEGRALLRETDAEIAGAKVVPTTIHEAANLLDLASRDLDATVGEPGERGLYGPTKDEILAVVRWCDAKIDEISARHPKGARAAR